MLLKTINKVRLIVSDLRSIDVTFYVAVWDFIIENALKHLHLMNLERIQTVRIVQTVFGVFIEFQSEKRPN